VSDRVGRRTADRHLGTTWEQLRPNTRENGGAGPTSKQDESTRWTSRPCLQNLHPRFKSGRRLQIPGSNSIVCVLAHKRASSIGLTVDYKSAGCCASLYAKQLIQNDLIVRALDKGEVSRTSTPRSGARADEACLHRCSATT
jgi:hypothetical protein